MGARKARLSPLQAIRAMCLDCCGGQLVEVRECPASSCPLWPYRFGKHPGKARESEEVERE